MTADELVEAVARAIYEAWRDHCDIREDTPEWGDAHHSERNLNRSEARAAIRAVHAAMREPSADMVRDAIARPHSYGPEDTTMYPSIWRAMLAAHPIAEAARDD
jgi:hypothetical protein